MRNIFRSTKKGFAVGGIIAIIIVVVFVAISAVLIVNANNKYAYYNDYDWYSVIEGNEHNGGIADNYRGDPSKAAVTIVEFADYQCSGCASMNPFVEQAIDELDGKLAVIHRHYLLSYHLNGTAAASAAIAAGLQGYWADYADLLFSNQSEWANASASERATIFDNYFTQVSEGKGDLEKFHSDIASTAVSEKLSFDQQLGKLMNVSGTPAFYVDDQFIDWSNPNGGTVKVNGYIIGWDHKLNSAEFVQILKDIVSAALEPVPGNN